jgi:6-pyruvoyltetrahydropterin/6-carboxytetrahydropterin synthase
MRVSVTKQFEFEACHHLPDYDGACARNHGHTYKMDVEVEGEIDKTSGMVLDFSILKRMVKNLIVDKFDHQDLNDFYDMPTAENMVVDIFNTLEHHLDGAAPVLKRVRLWETSSSYAEAKC